MEESKRFVVLKQFGIDPETGSGKPTWYGDFDTKEEAEQYMEKEHITNAKIYRKVRSSR